MTLPTLTAIIVGASIAYLAWIAWVCRNAPLGWEDSEGWHAGEPGDDQ